VVSSTPRPHFTPGIDPVPIVLEAGWAPGPVWTGAKDLGPIGVRSPDRPTRSQSLHRLSYRAHMYCAMLSKVLFTVRCILRYSKEIGSGESCDSLLTVGLIKCLQNCHKSTFSRVCV
jgi:hypothetical protein